MIGNSNIEQIFTALDRQIEAKGGKAISLVVCGGTALAALGLIPRTTKDVDIIGRWEDGRINKMGSLPPWLSSAAEKVGRDFQLPEDWLNLGPESQLDTGLPEGLPRRLKKRIFGKFLSVLFVDRKDQIFFKLYAALDRGGYHEDDLFLLRPTEAELLAASRWVLTQDVSEGFRKILISFLKSHDHDKIAERI